MYTPIVTDLNTHIYAEIIDEISREDSTILTSAISAAIREAKMYLSRFNLVQLFGDPIAGTSATFTDDNLTDMVKDIAAWKFIRLAKTDVNYEHIKTCYEQAIKSLKEIQKGNAMPDGWPYKDTTGETAPQGDAVFVSSRNKRRNDY